MATSAKLAANRWDALRFTERRKAASRPSVRRSSAAERGTAERCRVYPMLGAAAPDATVGDGCGLAGIVAMIQAAGSYSASISPDSTACSISRMLFRQRWESRL